MNSTPVPKSGPNWGLIAGGVLVLVIIIVMCIYFFRGFGGSGGSSPNVSNLASVFLADVPNCPDAAMKNAVWQDSVGYVAVPNGQNCPINTSSAGQNHSAKSTFTVCAPPNWFTLKPPQSVNDAGIACVSAGK